MLRQQSQLSATMDGTSARAALGLSAGASRHEVKRAYRALAKRSHPDAGGNREWFEYLTLAYNEATASQPVALSVHPFLVANALTSHDSPCQPRTPRRRRQRPGSFAWELSRAMAG